MLLYLTDGYNLIASYDAVEQVTLLTELLHCTAVDEVGRVFSKTRPTGSFRP